MGQLINVASALATANTLNWMFNTNLANTIVVVGSLRTAVPELLKAINHPPKRRESLRFAAFLLNDQIPFTVNDPVDHKGAKPKESFKKWLRWLTWIDLEDAAGWVDGNGHALASAPGFLIRQTIDAALARPVPISFTWNEKAAGKPVLSIDTTNAALWKIDMLSISVKGVNKNSDDEDDDPSR
jgi:hypothetical protein